MEAMNFQYDIPAFLPSIIEDPFVPMFNFTSMQDPTEKCHYPDLVGEPLRLELHLTFPLEHALN